MGDVAPELRRRRDAALLELAAYFEKRGNSRSLEAGELLNFKAFAGWATTVEMDGKKVPLLLTVDSRLPFSLPKLYLTDKTVCLKIPHVNDDGFVCVLPTQATWSQVRTAELVEDLLVQARDLLLGPVRRDDFIDEFQNYWRCQTLGKTNVWSILDPGGSSRSVAFFPGQEYTLIGEEISDCRDWLTNKFNRPEPFNTPWLKTVLTSDDVERLQIRTTMFLRLDGPLYPEDYPKSSSDVAKLAKRAGTGAYYRLIEELQAADSSLPILIGFDTSNGPALACVWISRPANIRNGFRGAAPKEVVEARWFSRAPVSPVEVRRADPYWLTARTGGDDASSILRRKRVVVVGCGSLGADIALLLAKAGVGNFILIDGDLLDWDNVGRHLLGGSDVGRRKDEALRRYLVSQLPHLWVKRPDEAKWELAYAKDPTVLSKADLVISTTGDWSSESALNVIARRRLNIPPILFGWTEPFGVGGHALAVLDSGGCLGCGMTELGKFQDTLSEWPHDAPTLKRAPACSEFFQPYGPIEAGPIKTTIATLAIDVLLRRATLSTLRTWVGARVGVEAAGGKWTNAWKAKYGDPGEGNLMRASDWARNPRCELCK